MLNPPFVHAKSRAAESGVVGGEGLMLGAGNDTVSRADNTVGSGSNNFGFGVAPLSEFPSLTGKAAHPTATNSVASMSSSSFSSLRQHQQNNHAASLLTLMPPAKQQYSKKHFATNSVGTMKAHMGENNSKFNMIKEDFPALPGTQSASNVLNGNSQSNNNPASASTSTSVVGNRYGSASAVIGAEKHHNHQQQQAPPPPPPPHHSYSSVLPLPQHQHHPYQQLHHNPYQSHLQPSVPQPPPSKQLIPFCSDEEKGIRTSLEGRVTNIPSSMMKDQYGMAGLLTFIRAAEYEKNLVPLALGVDLTTLGLNLNAPGNLHPTFAGPWVHGPCKPDEIDTHVPPEYLINHSIKHRLPELKFSKLSEDILFFVFFMYRGDALQLAAARELYARNWRFHTEEKVWISHTPGLGIFEKTATYERGMYYYFDVVTWRKIAKEFHLDYNKLDMKMEYLYPSAAIGTANNLI